jgi:hypothetical protein
MTDERFRWVQILTYDFCFSGTELLVYSWDKRLHRADDYMEKQAVCRLFLVLLDVRVEVMTKEEGSGGRPKQTA